VERNIFEMFETLKQKALSYNPDLCVERLVRAFEIAQKAHEGQVRNTGEPYMIHPLSVAQILAEMELDCDSLVSALLHDVVEDTEMTTKDIAEEFGESVATIVDGVTKLGKIQYTTKEEQQVENLRKMFLAMAKDVRVILIKLADRLHNMRTLKFMSEEKQREKARETLEVYAALAHRLGMSKIKWELEDIALRYIDPIAYKEITESISQKRKEREEYIDDIINNIGAKLNELGVKAHLTGRAKHFYSIFRKMYAQNKTIDEIYDLFAVRAIVDSVKDCYAVLGLVLEAVYKTDYTSLLNAFLQNELGLTATQISDKSGDLGNYWDWKADDAYLSAGAITSNISDMLLYAKGCLEGNKYFAKCHNSLLSINASSEMYRTMGINMDEIGMAWLIDSKNGIVWHNGGTGNYNSYLGFNPMSGVAVVVLSNLAPNYRIPATVLGLKLLLELSNEK